MTYALERDIKIPWQAASFISAYVQGGAAYAKGKAKTISGVTTNDATGKITVKLVAPFAPIVDIFALPGTAPVPPEHADEEPGRTGTIGDGPYMWGTISPGHTYTLVKNPKFDVPGLPKGHADKIVYNVNSNVLANAQAVLNNKADVFDPGDTLPAVDPPAGQDDRGQPLPARAAELELVLLVRVQKKPFNNLYARQAVLAAMDDRAFSRLDSGFQAPDCHLIPFGIIGHSSPSSCPFHNPAGRAEHDPGQAADGRSRA